MRRPLSPSTLLACAVCVWLLAAAPAALAETPLEQYQRTGKIDPCTVSGGGGIPNDVEQYAPDFKAALDDARSQGCSRGGSSGTAGSSKSAGGVPVTGGGGGSLPPGTRYVPKPPAPPRATHAQRTAQHLPLATTTEAGTPAPVIVLAVMALLALVGGAVVGTGRRLGWGAERLDPLRHAFAELGLRLRSLTRRGV